jgi:hypothetical protein
MERIANELELNQQWGRYQALDALSAYPTTLYPQRQLPVVVCLGIWAKSRSGCYELYLYSYSTAAQTRITIDRIRSSHRVAFDCRLLPTRKLSKTLEDCYADVD